jgi:hypothetical protein
LLLCSVRRPAVTVQDVHATVLHSLGIDPYGSRLSARLARSHRLPFFLPFGN